MGKRELHRISLVVVYGLLSAMAVLTLIPFAWMLIGAFKTNAEHLFLPPGDGLFGVAWGQLTLRNFVRFFTDPSLGMGRSMVNSFFLSSVIAVLSTLCAASGGYALAKYRFPGRSLVSSVVLGALLIPGPLLMAPGYELLHELGLIDRWSGLIAPALAPAFGVFLFRQSMLNSVPDEVLECARIDGAGELRIFLVIVLPIIRPMVGAFLLITFLGTWNNFISPQIVLQSQELFPLSVAINNLKGLQQQDFGLIMAGTVISIAPVMALFLLLQKEFISGLTSGAVKG